MSTFANTILHKKFTYRHSFKTPQRRLSPKPPIPPLPQQPDEFTALLAEYSQLTQPQNYLPNITLPIRSLQLVPSQPKPDAWP